jgi:hypothetical protein
MRTTVHTTPIASAVLWTHPGFPRKGWAFEEMDDLGKPSHRCEACAKEGVRFVHVLSHPDWEQEIHVGCICAEKLTGNLFLPKAREAAMKNRYNRMVNFLAQKWQSNCKGNFVLTYKGNRMTIMRSQYDTNTFGVAYDGEFVWKYKGQKIGSLDTAKRLAFELSDDTNETHLLRPERQR